jgi:hypothetical protein
MNQGRLICGKYGSLWKWEYSHHYMRGVKKVKGVYTTAMELCSQEQGWTGPYRTRPLSTLGNLARNI